MLEMLWQGFSCDQEDYRNDKKNDDKPLSNRPCDPPNKSKNHKYNGYYDEQYSEC